MPHSNCFARTRCCFQGRKLGHIKGSLTSDKPHDSAKCSDGSLVAVSKGTLKTTDVLSPHLLDFGTTFLRSLWRESAVNHFLKSIINSSTIRVSLWHESTTCDTVSIYCRVDCAGQGGQYHIFTDTFHSSWSGSSEEFSFKSFTLNLKFLPLLQLHMWGTTGCLPPFQANLRLFISLMVLTLSPALSLQRATEIGERACRQRRHC